MSTTVPASAETTLPPALPRRIGLRLALAAVALVELTDGITILMLLHGDMSGLGAIIKLNIVAQPMLALAALIFALIGHFRHAILALGAIVLLAWLKFLALVPQGFGFGMLVATPHGAAQAIVFPLFGVCAMALAGRGERLGIATMLIAIPTLVSLFNGLAFLIGVMIYGF